jgi:asparagine synthase (glutamine-hydrolysing)
MCGITGFVDLRGGRPLSQARLDRMVDSMQRRGPDDRGTVLLPQVALGMRRLSILDLEGGHQPMQSSSGRVSVVMNGEIYAAPDLRRELEQGGSVFATRSDTEVLLHGYEAWGLDGLLQRLCGMYAFALHDRAREELHLVRDRLGIKPLLWCERDGWLLFGSANAALLASGLLRPEPDPLGLRLYLRHQFVPGVRTALAGVQRLPPGSVLTVRGGTVVGPRTYWRLPDAEPDSDPRRDWQDELRAALERSVREHMLSDVEVGIFLSGGLDSSTVLGLMRRAEPGRIRAFSVAFPGHDRHDESAHAAAAAARFGAELRSVPFDAAQAAEVAAEVIATIDEPIGDAACLPTFLLARLAAAEVKVVQSGEGADELFAGYDYYRQPRPWTDRMLERLRGGAGKAPSGFPLALARAQAEALLRPLAMEPGTLARSERELAAAGAGNARDPLLRALRADASHWLPDDLLTKVDRTTMAWSLEARVPFLDHRVVELALAMPSALKVAGGAGKAVLRSAFADLLGPELAQRSKHGFDLPMDQWLRGPLRPLLVSAFSDLRDLPWLDPAPLHSLWHSHDAGARHERALWMVCVLAGWWRVTQEAARDAAVDAGS